MNKLNWVVNWVSNPIWGALCWNWAIHSRKLCNANGIKAMILSRSGKGTPKLNARNAIQGYFSDTEHFKYNTNGIKSRSSKNIDSLKVKKRYSWFQCSKKIQQHFCWRLVNHCYKCGKQKIIASKHEKQDQT